MSRTPNQRKRRPPSSRPFHRLPRGHAQKPLRNANALPLAEESHTASQQIPRLKCGRGAATSRSIFLFRTRAGFVESLRTYCTSSTRPAWRYHVPRIWNRSINVREFPVKRKTQNMVDVYVLCLFVVVPFLRNRRRFNAFASFHPKIQFLHPIQNETLFSSLPGFFFFLASSSFRSGPSAVFSSLGDAFCIRRKTSRSGYS